MLGLVYLVWSGPNLVPIISYFLHQQSWTGKGEVRNLKTSGSPINSSSEIKVWDWLEVWHNVSIQRMVSSSINGRLLHDRNMMTNIPQQATNWLMPRRWNQLWIDIRNDQAFTCVKQIFRRIHFSLGVLYCTWTPITFQNCFTPQCRPKDTLRVVFVLCH